MKKQGYYDMIADMLTGKAPLPSFGDNSVFVCPAAGEVCSHFNGETKAGDTRYFWLWGKDPINSAAPAQGGFD
jgi:hypothetical protein